MRKRVTTFDYRIGIICCLLLGSNLLLAQNIPHLLEKTTVILPPSDSLIHWINENVQLFEGHDSILGKTRLVLAYAKDTQNDSLAAIMHEALATWFYYNVDDVNVDSSLFHSKQALKYYERTNNLANIAASKVLIASDLSMQNQFKPAQEYLFEAIATYEQLDDPQGLAMAYEELSSTLYDLELYEDALRYGQRAWAIYQQLNDPFDKAISLFQLVPIHIKLNQLDTALVKANRSIDLIEQNYEERAVYTLANAYASRGTVYEANDQLEAALNDHLKAYNLVKATTENDEPVGWEDEVGNIYFKQGRYQKAIPFFEASFAHDADNAMKARTWELKEKLSICYRETQQLEKALFWQKAAWEERDTLLNEKIAGLQTELQVKYETAEKEATIDTQKMQLNQQAKIQNLTYGIVGLLTLLLGGIFWNFQKNKEKNRQLAQLNQDLAVKNDQNELLLKEIHHRVKNNLELVKSLLSLQSAQLDDPEVQAAIQASQNRVQSMSIIHQKLYQGKNLAAIEMKDYFSNLGEGVLDAFAADDRVQIECVMNELELDVDTAVPIGLIVNELLTNALKYAFPKGQMGKIKIELMDKKDVIELKVKDNGVGKVKNRAAKGTGFGTQLVQLLTMQLDGTMEERVENGTVVLFRFRKSIAA